ncbi:hypothetical protein AKJ16_DCAP24152, partial [Drosera capensis]
QYLVLKLDNSVPRFQMRSIVWGMLQSLVSPSPYPTTTVLWISVDSGAELVYRSELGESPIQT